MLQKLRLVKRPFRSRPKQCVLVPFTKTMQILCCKFRLCPSKKPVSGYFNRPAGPSLKGRTEPPPPPQEFWGSRGSHICLDIKEFIFILCSKNWPPQPFLLTALEGNNNLFSCFVFSFAKKYFSRTNFNFNELFWMLEKIHKFLTQENTKFRVCYCEKSKEITRVNKKRLHTI